jgi:hypothetical protein
MHDYLKTTFWDNFNWALYLRILEAKAKKENLI